MINASTITKGMFDLLNDGLPTDYHIERSEYINMDPDKTPYIGIYRGKLEYDPHTLGRGANNQRADFTIKLIIQAASLESGRQAEERLEKYIETTLDVIMADKTIRKTVGIVKNIQIEYSYQREKSGSMHFQFAEIDILTEARTQ